MESVRQQLHRKLKLPFPTLTYDRHYPAKPGLRVSKSIKNPRRLFFNSTNLKNMISLSGPTCHDPNKTEIPWDENNTISRNLKSTIFSKLSNLIPQEPAVLRGFLCYFGGERVDRKLQRTIELICTNMQLSGRNSKTVTL